MRKTHKRTNSNSTHTTTNSTDSTISSLSTSTAYSTQQSPLPLSYFSSSQPQLVDLARCNQQRFWRLVTWNLKRYLTCFKPTQQPRTKDKKRKVNMDYCEWPRNVGDNQKSKNCNYYSEMNAEERAEKLKSAIIYCKDSKC